MRMRIRDPGIFSILDPGYFFHPACFSWIVSSRVVGQEEEEVAALRTLGDQVMAGNNSYRFDHVFHGTASQQDLYTTLIHPLVNHAVSSNFLLSIYYRLR
jgi:hypothetical protein